jgi:hypothetical protein
MVNTALAGFGLAYVPEDVAEPHLLFMGRFPNDLGN